MLSERVPFGRLRSELAWSPESCSHFPIARVVIWSLCYYIRCEVLRQAVCCSLGRPIFAAIRGAARAALLKGQWASERAVRGGLTSGRQPVVLRAVGHRRSPSCLPLGAGVFLWSGTPETVQRAALGHYLARWRNS